MSGPWVRASNGAGSGLPMPWLRGAWQQAMAQRGHALILHGPEGVGQFELAALLAQTWLCERAAPGDLPCGQCDACHLLHAGAHPDLRVLAPQALRDTLGLEGNDAAAEGADGAGEGSGGSTTAAGEGSSAGGAKGKAAGREIRVADVRAAIDWAHQSSSRSRAKVLLIHPAQRLNLVAANALLKTLEEPPGLLRLVLSAADPQALMPTLRSRCQRLALSVPPADQARAWLASSDQAQAGALLEAAGGRPQEALAMARDGLTGELWPQLPAWVRAGRIDALTALPVPRVIDVLQKLCLDLTSRALGAPVVYFPQDALPAGARLEALSEWWQRLQRAARHEDHPWNATLLIESLVTQGRQCWNTRSNVR